MWVRPRTHRNVNKHLLRTPSSCGPPCIASIRPPRWTNSAGLCEANEGRPRPSPGAFAFRSTVITIRQRQPAGSILGDSLVECPVPPPVLPGTPPTLPIAPPLVHLESQPQ